MDRIFVGGIPLNLTQDHVRGYFERFGAITDVRACCDS